LKDVFYPSFLREGTGKDDFDFIATFIRIVLNLKIVADIPVNHSLRADIDFFRDGDGVEKTDVYLALAREDDGESQGDLIFTFVFCPQVELCVRPEFKGLWE